MMIGKFIVYSNILILHFSSGRNSSIFTHLVSSRLISLSLIVKRSVNKRQPFFEYFRLRYVQEGYYKCVSEYTPKLLLKQIESLFNIETNIGRGRAWLFFALNDSLMESYIKCFQDNKKLVKKFYTSDSIVNDTQVGVDIVRFNMLPFVKSRD
jgi:hypothetical protein